MIPQPLHPAVVHFPIVLVVLLPVVAITAVVLIRRGSDTRGAWLPVVAVALALSGSAWLAMETGEHEEERVERVVAESAIHGHEEAAELFVPLTFAGLLLAVAGLTPGRGGRIARSVTVVAAMGLLVAGYRVGHSGGALVYEAGAAQAYARPTEALESADAEGAEHEAEDAEYRADGSGHRDEDGERRR